MTKNPSHYVLYNLYTKYETGPHKYAKPVVALDYFLFCSKSGRVKKKGWQLLLIIGTVN